MEISVYDEVNGNGQLTVPEMAAMSPSILPLQERVPAVSGRAFDVKAWYRAWSEQNTKAEADQGKEPVLLKVEASDEFQAVIPWPQLDQACFLFEQEDGQPLQKGYPLRLYVPDGSSECLNVKSIVGIYFLYEGQAEQEATYGFKNMVSLDEMKLRK